MCLIVSLIGSLFGCTPAPSSTTAAQIIKLFVTCGDQRSDLVLLLGADGITPDVHVIRRIGGAAGLTEADFQYLAEYYRVRGMTIGEINLIDHLDETCPACGALNAHAKQLEGAAVHPDEVGVWLNDNLTGADAYQEVRAAAQRASKAIPNAEVNAWLQTNSTQRMIPVETVGQKVYVEEAAWKAWPTTALPDITSANVESAGVKRVLALNELARPNAELVASQLKYSTGQPFEAWVLSSRTDSQAVLMSAGTFQVTALPGREASAVKQIAYGFAHWHPTSSLEILAVEPAELTRMLNELNTSPTFLNLIKDPAWIGGVDARIGSAMPIQLRSDVPLPRLYPPISGGSGMAATVRMAELPVPGDLTEAALSETLAKAGVNANRSVISQAIAKLAPYAGKVLRVAVIGLEVTAAVIIIDEIGDMVFGWGPMITVNSATILPEDPEVLSKIRVLHTNAATGEPEYVPAWWLTTGSNPGMELNLFSVWDKAQELMRTGKPAAGGFVLSDPRIPMIPGLTDIVVQPSVTGVAWFAYGKPDEPERIVLMNVFTQKSVTFAFETGAEGGPYWNLTEGSVEDLAWGLNSNGMGVSCRETIGVDKTSRYRITFLPECK